jgi:hypothetical protein
LPLLEGWLKVGVMDIECPEQKRDVEALLMSMDLAQRMGWTQSGARPRTAVASASPTTLTQSTT